MYISCYWLLYVGDASILFVGRLINLLVKIYIIYSMLRLYFYLIMVITSPIWMNLVIMSGFIVKRLITMCGIKLIYIVIYIRLKYYIYWF